MEKEVVHTANIERCAKQYINQGLRSDNMLCGFIMLITSILAYIDWMIYEFSDSYIGGIIASIITDIGIIGFILCCYASIK